VTLLLTFRQVGSIRFASGSILLAFGRPDLVVHTGRLSDQQRLDAVASSQIIPGRS
jgi:chromate transport protein ChrA